MSNLSNELARRAATAANEPAPAAPAAKASGWNPVGIVAIIAALGGPAVVVPLVTGWVAKLEADAAYARQRARESDEQQKQMTEDIKAARRTCGEALDLANRASSRAAAAEELAESALKRRRKD